MCFVDIKSLKDTFYCPEHNAVVQYKNIALRCVLLIAGRSERCLLTESP